MTKVRKVIKTGNSMAITIPTKVLKSFNIREGDLARLKINYTKGTITYLFSGQPRQLSLIDKSARKD